jgi:hypothetical protein
MNLRRYRVLEAHAAALRVTLTDIERKGGLVRDRGGHGS